MKLTLSTRPGFALIAVGAVGLVAAGLVVGEIYRLQPCPLCIFQRFLYLVVGALGVLGVVLPAFQAIWRLLIGGVALGGVATAAWQSWLQWAPLGSVAECSYTDPNLIERFVDWLGMKSPALFLATGFCSNRDWTFLGLSMANWSIPCFAGFLVVAAMISRR